MMAREMRSYSFLQPIEDHVALSLPYPPSLLLRPLFLLVLCGAAGGHGKEWEDEGGAEGALISSFPSVACMRRSVEAKMERTAESVMFH